MSNEFLADLEKATAMFSDGMKSLATSNLMSRLDERKKQIAQDAKTQEEKYLAGREAGKEFAMKLASVGAGAEQIRAAREFLEPQLYNSLAEATIDMARSGKVEEATKLYDSLHKMDQNKIKKEEAAAKRQSMLDNQAIIKQKSELARGNAETFVKLIDETGSAKGLSVDKEGILKFDPNAIDTSSKADAKASKDELASRKVMNTAGMADQVLLPGLKLKKSAVGTAALTDTDKNKIKNTHANTMTVIREMSNIQQAKSSLMSKYGSYDKLKAKFRSGDPEAVKAVMSMSSSYSNAFGIIKGPDMLNLGASMTNSEKMLAESMTGKDPTSAGNILLDYLVESKETTGVREENLKQQLASKAQDTFDAYGLYVDQTQDRTIPDLAFRYRRGDKFSGEAKKADKAAHLLGRQQTKNNPSVSGPAAAFIKKY